MRYTKQLLPVLTLLLVATAACGSDNGVLGSSPSGTVTPEVAADLAFLREEEKLARDVYLELESVWGSMIFQNISQAEQQHMDQVAIRLAALGLPDPMTDNTLGVFNNQVLADLYAELVSQGKLSETEALVVGATIEDLDIQSERPVSDPPSPQPASEMEEAEASPSVESLCGGPA